jgi:hypothetical protein
METIEKLIKTTHDMLELAKSSSKGGGTAGNNIRTSTTAAPAVKVTGRDNDLEGITKILRDESVVDSNCFSVIGLHGISGSGKTTLAQHVCNYEKVEGKHFDLIMWIHVTRNYSVRNIFMQMYELASDRQCRRWSNIELLERKLEGKLKGRKFLLVLDDIWCNKDARTKELPRLLSPLKVGKRGSRILATSQNATAFADLGPGLTFTGYKMSELDDKFLLDILIHNALGHTEAKNVEEEKFISIGYEIVKKLNGSALAASTVGEH